EGLLLGRGLSVGRWAGGRLRTASPWRRRRLPGPLRVPLGRLAVGSLPEGGPPIPRVPLGRCAGGRLRTASPRRRRLLGLLRVPLGRLAGRSLPKGSLPLRRVPLGRRAVRSLLLRLSLRWLLL